MKIILKINNSLTHILNIDNIIKNKLYDLLSYKQQNSYFFKEQLKKKYNQGLIFKNYPYNLFLQKIEEMCYIRFFDKKYSSFPTGLLSIVIDYLRENNFLYTIEDTRKIPTVKKIYRKINQPPTLRYYQKEIVEKCLENHRGIIEAATGSGKTNCIIELIYQLKNNILITVPSSTILSQFYNILLHVFGKKHIGIITGNKKELNKSITIATYQSLLNISKDFFDNINTLIMDEAHHNGCDSIVELNKKFFNNIYYRYHFSVTENTRIVLKDKFNSIYQTTFKKHFDKISQNYQLNIEKEQLQIRSFNNKIKKFEWDNITHVLKHKTNKKIYNIKTNMYKKEISLTEDHSIYKVIPKNKCYVQNSIRYKNIDIQKIKPNELKVNDLILQETQIDLPQTDNIFDLFDYLNNNDLHRINLLVNSSVKEINLLKKDKTINSWQKYNYKNLKFPNYIPYKYKKNKANISSIYITGKTGEIYNRYFTINKYLSWLIGYFVADGWISKHSKKKSNRISFAVNIKDIEKLDFILKKLNIKYIVKEKRKDTDKMIYVHISSFWLYKFFSSFYVKHDKIRLPNFCFNFSKTNKKHLLSGYLQGDGHIEKAKLAKKTINRYSAVSKSKELICDFALIAKSLGYVSTIYSNFCKNLSGKICEYFHFHFQKENSNKYLNKIKIKNNYQVLKIKSIKEINYNSYVYDFTVKNNQNFVANDILVSNTGTAYRNDGKDMDLQSVISNKFLYKYPIQQGIEDQYLVPIKFYIYKYPHQFSKRNWRTELKECIVGNYKYNQMIIEKAKKLNDKNIPTIIFVDQIEHGKLLERNIPDSVFVNGTEERSINLQTIEDFNKGKLNILIGTSVIGEGVDTVRAKCGIIAGGGKAKSTIVQRIGRLLRPSPDKKCAYLIDFTHDNTKYLQEHFIKRYNIYKTFGEKNIIFKTA